MSKLTDQQRATLVKKILEFLNRSHQRATYTAVAEAIDGSKRRVGPDWLKVRRPEASWVVSAVDGEPTDYPSNLLHPELFFNTHIIETGIELLRAMALAPGPPRP